ncbi:hypothetical protein KL930_002048 [Ogataea haglerorum]|nr:hypothetical protein KL914_001117 [Ogataea haglerorum]KAG7744178.1 hypothetical protein KL932_001501 [Ogataea haglerorum]KAG7770854.1 hypothetical protein KL931_001676 [Ogataea haglerorum]KAG7779403.1 hypothetical protein KL930_002048 [Ogataea haglerorum]KAG7779987.1 hypothetical protein KL922_001272 [Ogataea haglerorum]
MNIVDARSRLESDGGKNMNTPTEIFRSFRLKDKARCAPQTDARESQEKPQNIQDGALETANPNVSITSILMPSRNKCPPQLQQEHRAIDPHNVVLKLPKRPKVSGGSLLQNGRFTIQSPRVRPETFNVTLKMDSEKLRTALHAKQVHVVDLEQEEAIIKHEKPQFMNSFFRDVSEGAKRADSVELIRKDKPKSMDVPVLGKLDFMIYDKYDIPQHAYLRLQHRKREQSTAHELSFSQEEHAKLMKCFIKKSQARSSQYTYRHLHETMEDVVRHKYQTVQCAPFNRLCVDQFCDASAQWCDLFRPSHYQHILQPQTLNTDLYFWLKNMFVKLRRVDIEKRTKLLRKRRAQAEMDDFLVDEAYESGNETEDEVFVPCLIIEGPTGSGKTSAVYSIVKEQLQGHVFELNSSQNRARKSINFHLRQIGTTKNVKNGQDYGLILFDDVDLIDDEDDKDFWQAVTELLTYSYRPVVLTTQDLSKIPPNIVDQSTVYRFIQPNHSVQAEYLDLIGLRMGMKLDDNILQELCGYDLRHSLMQLQLLGSSCDRKRDGLVEIRKEDSPEAAPLASLQQLEHDLEMRYCTESLGQADPAVGVSVAHRQTVDFYSSKLYQTGSRSRATKYLDGEEYLAQNPGCVFNRVSRSVFSAEVQPFIKEMARGEMVRIQLGGRRLFDLNPVDYFDKLF